MRFQHSKGKIVYLKHRPNRFNIPHANPSYMSHITHKIHNHKFSKLGFHPNTDLSIESILNHAEEQGKGRKESQERKERSR
jgi:hypothetical protein